jgi:hypothetical protein
LRASGQLHRPLATRPTPGDLRGADRGERRAGPGAGRLGARHPLSTSSAGHLRLEVLRQMTERGIQTPR